MAHHEALCQLMELLSWKEVKEGTLPLKVLQVIIIGYDLIYPLASALDHTWMTEHILLLNARQRRKYHQLAWLVLNILQFDKILALFCVDDTKSCYDCIGVYNSCGLDHW